MGKSSWSTQPTRPSGRTQESTGSSPKNTTKESSEDSPPLARSTEATDKRDTELTVSDHPREHAGEAEMSSNGEEAETPWPARHHNKPTLRLLFNALFICDRFR